MDDGISDPHAAAYTEITVRIPGDLARSLGAGAQLERRVLPAPGLPPATSGISRAAASP